MTTTRTQSATRIDGRPVYYDNATGQLGNGWVIDTTLYTEWAVEVRDQPPLHCSHATDHGLAIRDQPQRLGQHTFHPYLGMVRVCNDCGDWVANIVSCITCKGQGYWWGPNDPDGNDQLRVCGDCYCGERTMPLPGVLAL